MPELEYVLQTLVPTEFKDERLASKRVSCLPKHSEQLILWCVRTIIEY